MFRIVLGTTRKLLVPGERYRAWFCESLGVVSRLRRVLRPGEGKCYSKLKTEPGPEPALLLPRPVVFPLFPAGVSSATPVLQSGRDYREGLTLGARSPIVFSNNNSFWGM